MCRDEDSRHPPLLLSPLEHGGEREIPSVSVKRRDDTKIVGNRYSRDIGDTPVQGLGVVPGLLSLANPLEESLERGVTYCADLLLKEDDVPELPKELSRGFFPPLGVWLDVAAGIGRD